MISHINWEVVGWVTGVIILTIFFGWVYAQYSELKSYKRFRRLIAGCVADMPYSQRTEFLRTFSRLDKEGYTPFLPNISSTRDMGIFHIEQRFQWDIAEIENERGDNIHHSNV